MHELIPGLLLALREGRDDDAIELARVVTEEVNDPTVALLEMATAANYLHRNSGVPLALLAVMVREDQEIDDPRTHADLSREFLNVVTEMLAGGALSEASENALATYDLRPGSSQVIRQLARVTTALVADLQVQLMAHREPSDARAQIESTFKTVEAAVARGELEA